MDAGVDRVNELFQVGLTALAKARRVGIAVCYMEPAYGENIIREYPDGQREMIDRSKNGLVVAIPPRE